MQSGQGGPAKESGLQKRGKDHTRSGRLLARQAHSAIISQLSGSLEVAKRANCVSEGDTHGGITSYGVCAGRV